MAVADVGVTVILVALLCALSTAHKTSWRDWKLPVQERVADLISQLTLEEKVSHINTWQAAIPRLGIPYYGWWGECNHGAREEDWSQEGFTVWPQTMAIAAAFDTSLAAQMADLTADELRAKSNEWFREKGSHRHINCHGPNINIFRDPRWGRGSETYGEDPYLTSKYAVAFIQALQGNDERYIKVNSVCKHFAAYSLEQAEGESRMSFNAIVNEADWADTYSPAFKACVMEGGSNGIMCAFNRINGTPACSSPWLMEDTLRKEWGFKGYVVTDCPGLSILHEFHDWEEDHEHAYAATIKAGTDMACPYPREDPTDLNILMNTVKSGLLSEERVNEALARIYTVRFRLGQFDPPEELPWANLTTDIIGSPKHIAATVNAARKSIVLLKNEPYNGGGPLPHTQQQRDAKGADDNNQGKKEEEENEKGGRSPLAHGGPILPLRAEDLKRVAVIGPAAARAEWMLGSKIGKAKGHVTTPLQALEERLPHAHIEWQYGAQPEAWPAKGVDESVRIAKEADLAIVFFGSSGLNWYNDKTYHSGMVEDGPPGQINNTVELICPVSEGEERDRQMIRLTGFQEDVIKGLAKRTRTPIVVVLIHGGPLDVSWMRDSPRVSAMMTAWYPGQGGQAITEVLFGDVNPSGRLPTTWYHENFTQQVSMLSMDMRAWPGRTHRFVQVPVVYEFGYGLSFTTFSYSGLKADQQKDGDDIMRVQVTVRNSGHVAGEEVVLLFATHASAQLVMEQRGAWLLPRQSLVGFKRIGLGVGEEKRVELVVSGRELDDTLAGARVVLGSDALAALPGGWHLRAGDQHLVVPTLNPKTLTS